MASEDVIELGSSEDEAEPAPKKKKPMPNAMVHIPAKRPGLTIKPAKINKSPGPKILNFTKGVLSKPIMISNIPVLKKVPNIIHRAPSNPHRFSINPISVVKTLKKPDLTIKKVPSNNRLRKPVEIQGPRLLNKLPPSITVKSLACPSVSGINKQRNKKDLKNTIGEVLTVEVEDEEAAETSIESPQWYLRPEEQAHCKNETKDCGEVKSIDKNELSLEEQNNKEPETPSYVEITIEDSPVKSLHLKDESEIGKEFAITIEDSPIKPVKNKNVDSPVKSLHLKDKSEIGKEFAITIEDSPVKPSKRHVKNKNVDSDREQSPERVPQSKKKLDYPKERQVVEIEIDLMETGSFNCNENKDDDKQNIESNISSKDESKKTSYESFSSKHESNVANDYKSDADKHEFHPVYQNFIETCFMLENSEDMKKIVEKKIKAYYKQCPKEYVESEDFIDMVSSKIVAMKAIPKKMYLYIKDIVDDLNLQRKMKKVIPPKSTDTSEETDKLIHFEGDNDSKKQRQIRKLEKTIKKLHRAIQKLEEQEVDFEDDEDSVYLLTERYKERMVRVHAKFCQLTSTKMPSEPRIHLEVRPGRPAGPVRKLEKWINRKVPIGKPLPFPDFHDVLQCVREANNEDKLGWNEVDIMEEARDLFSRCGKKLQRRRQENEWRLAISRIPHDVDPAEESVELKKKLDLNQFEASKREAELLNKYVDRQNQLKLVAEEINDKEAEESPVETEEEEIDEDNPLTNKQKRKKRLKRLLQERNRKTEEKENNPEKENEDNKDDDNKNDKKLKLEEENKIREDNLNKVVNIDNDTQQRHEVDSDKSNAREKREETAQTIEIEDKKETDDSDKNEENEFESDIDELHLLQKLHSENESDVSTLESSGSDSPIAISDTLESDSDVENKNHASDVISIEDSSYSESESTVDGLPKQNEVNSIKKSKVEDLVSNAIEIESPTDSLRRTESENIVENILLASSDEENSNKPVEFEGTSINLKDDDISISETTIDGNPSTKFNDLNKTDSLKKNNATVYDCSFENENPSISIHKQGDEKNNINIDSAMECSDVDEIVNSSNLLKESINSVEFQMENNKLEINSSQTQSLNITKSCNKELSELNKNEKHKTQSATPTDGLTTNSETVNNNIETD